MNEVLRARIKRAKAILFFGEACPTKPKGRPISPENLKKYPPESICPGLESKSGKTLYYKRKTTESPTQKQEAKLTKQQQKLGSLKEGSKAHSTQAKRIENTKARIETIKKRLQAKVAKIREKAEEERRRVDEIPANSIKVDPSRFQFKILGSRNITGEVGSLSGIQKYDPNLAGILQVWKDPKDGQVYVVNGHNRLALAKRVSPNTKVAVMFLNTDSDKDARAIGALTNIAEGRGTPVDAAKFFRDTGINKEDLATRGIQLKDEIASKGLGISKLAPMLFNMVIDGDLEINLGAAIGSTGFDEHRQHSLYEMLKQRESRGLSVSQEFLGNLVDLIKNSSTSTRKEEDLFGSVDVFDDHFFELADLQTHVKRALSKEKRFFGVASRGAADLSKAGNIIDVEKSSSIAKRASEYLDVFDQFKNQKGELQQILDRGAARMKKAANDREKKAIKDDVYNQVYSNFPKFITALFQPKKQGGVEDMFGDGD